MMQCMADLEIHPDDQVRHLRLVFEHHQGDDVAIGRQVPSWIEAGGQLDQRFGLFPVDGHLVSHVLTGRFPGDVPPPPALLDGAAMVGGLGPGLEHGVAVGFGDDAANHQARDAEGPRRLVALQAGVAALETGAGGFLLVQRVEDHALFWVKGRNFNDIARLDEAHRDVVIEVKGTGRAGCDARGLKTRLGKYHHLALDRDIQSLQDGREVARPVVAEWQFDAAGLQLCVEKSDGVGGRAAGVFDGFVVQGHQEGSSQTGEGDHG
jgi:hypothetical protein